MIVTRGQSAWVIEKVLLVYFIDFYLASVAWYETHFMNMSIAPQDLIHIHVPNNSSETTREVSNSKGYFKDTKDWFEQWLVGVVDGDGSFTFSKSGEKWTLFFKVSQNTYNLRLLYHIKSNLGVGSVYIDPDNYMASYRLRKLSHIMGRLIPIFEKYSLLTSKYYNYDRFKQAAYILSNESLSSSEKDKLLEELSNPLSLRESHPSPVWLDLVSLDIDSVNNIMSKAWVIGFTEAEGSFYLLSKSKTQIVHSFTITQKLDKIVLEAIGIILNLRVKIKKTHLEVGTSSPTLIPKIINYYTGCMKGMKSLEFRIWSRSYNKNCKGIERYNALARLTKVRNQMRNIRSIRLNKKFLISHYAPLRNFQNSDKN